MGLFGKEPTFCGVCGNDVKAREGKLQAKDGVVCRVCYRISGITRMFGNLSDVTIDELRSGVDKNLAYAKAKEAIGRDEEISGLVIDKTQKKWYLDGMVIEVLRDNASTFQEAFGPIFEFDDIDEIWSTSGSVSYSKSKGKKSGVGRAIVGGVIAGASGAIVGAVTGKTSTTENTITTETNTVFITLHKFPGKTLRINVRSSREADKLVDIFSENKEDVGLAQPSMADELREFKSLLDDGIITQDEFDAKKKQLLNI